MRSIKKLKVKILFFDDREVVINLIKNGSLMLLNWNYEKLKQITNGINKIDTKKF